MPAPSGAGSTPPPSAPTVLRRGDTGQQVQALQSLLNLKGFGRLAVDGMFGPATEEAVKAAQRATHVDVDGVWGPITAAAVATNSQPPVPSAILRRGATGQVVREIQSLLNSRGFGPLNLDGIFGPATEAAVRAAQRATGATVDGIWGPQTAAALGR